MSRVRPTRSPTWEKDDAARNERARIARLQRDAGKSPGRNLEEGSAFVLFANEFAAAFAQARDRR